MLLASKERERENDSDKNWIEFIFKQLAQPKAIQW